MNDLILQLLGLLASGLISLLIAYLRSRMKSEGSAQLLDDLERAAQTAVAATSQQLSAKRLPNGKLAPPDARDARLFALQAAKSILGLPRVKALQKQYGIDGADLAILTLLESKLHEQKQASSASLPAIPAPASIFPAAPEASPSVDLKPLAPSPEQP